MLPAGIALAVGAAVGFEAAYLLQAGEARTVRAPRASGTLLALARRGRWLGGLALAAAGAALQILALHFAPLTVVQPVLALGVVFLVLAGGRIFGEPVAAADLLAALVLAGGVALIAVAGPEIERRPVHAAAAGVALAALAVLLTVAFLVRRAPPLLLVAGAGAGDALAALAAERLSAALDPFAVAALGWAALAAVAVAASLAVEMSAVRSWPVTRVGPLVLVCQAVIPVLLAPVVAGEDWFGHAPIVALGLLLVTAGIWRLAASAGLLDRAAVGASGDSGSEP